MTSPLNENLITTKEASELFGYTSDYLSRLIRSGKISGKRIGHNWLIEKKSLAQFLDTQGNHKIARARTLASERAEEYRAHRSLLHRTTKALTTPLPISQFGIGHIGHPMSNRNIGKPSFQSHAFALSVALLVVVSGAFVAHASAIPQFATSATEFARTVAFGFGETFGDIPARIVARIDTAKNETAKISPRVATSNEFVTANIASAVLANPDLSSLRMALGENQNTRTASQLGSSTSKLGAISAPMITADDVRTFALDTYAMLTSPSRAASALVNAYVALGENAYAGIGSAFTAYDSLIGSTAEKVLVLAATTRDALKTAPKIIANVNLALGTTVIDATHALIGAEVSASYGLAAAAPASARATVASLGTAGNALALAAERVPALATAAFLGATELPSRIAPAIAQAVFDAEYAGATRFIAATDAISSVYITSVVSAGALAYEGAKGTRGVISTAGPFIANVPDAFNDAYLGALGKTALAFETFARIPKVAAVLSVIRTTSAPMLAAVLPALTTGEKIALATYETIHNFINATGDALAFLFGPAQNFYPSRVPPRITTNATTTNSYPTYTTIVQGVSPDILNQSLAALRLDVFSAIAANTTRGIITRFSDSRGVSFANIPSISADTGTFGRLTAGDTNINGDFNETGNAIITGNFTTTGNAVVGGTLTAGFLSIAGLSSGEAITAPYFSATSTTATSTFAGPLAAFNHVESPYFTATSTTATSTFAGHLAIGTTTPWGDGFFTVGTTTPLLHISSNTGNIGIGTLASGYRLDLNGTLRAAGDAYFNSHVSLGDATTTDITYFNSRIADSLVPTADNILDLGDGTNWLRWRTGYFGTSVGIGGTATSTGTNLLTSGAYLLDTGSALSVNTTNNQPIIFGTGNVILPYASSTALTLASALWVGGNATTTSNGDFTANGNLTIRGATNDIAGTLNLSGGTLTSTAGLSLTSGGAGDLTLDSGSGSINIASGDDILAVGANSNIGSVGVKFNTLYADTISATTLIGVVSGGSTDAADWVINADNASDDTQSMTLAFERGTVTPNALLTWNVAENAKRFELNQPLFIQNASASTTLTTFDLKSVASQTADIFRIASSSGDYLLNFTSAGNIGIGTTSPSQALSVQGNALISGNLTAANLTATGTLSVTGVTTLATSLNGPLQANAGIVSATTSVLAQYGGTGQISYTIGDLLYASGSTALAKLADVAVNSVLVSGGVGAAPAYSSSPTIGGNVTINGSLTVLGALSPGIASTTLLSANQAWFGATATSTFTSQGWLGLASTSPSALLSVQGTSYVSGSSFFGGAITATSTITASATTTATYFAASERGFAGAPAFTFSSDLTTGLWSPLANTLALSTAGAERLRIDSSGNVGIGTTTPSVKFSVGGIAGDTSGHGYFTGGLGVGIVNTVAGTFQTTGAATIGGSLTVSGLCVTGDTRLRRRRKAKKGEEDEADEDGYIYDEVAIKDVQEGDEIQSLDDKTGELVWSRVKQLAYMGRKQTYKLTTASGKQIRTTANHPYLTRKTKNPDLSAGAALTKSIVTYAFIDLANIFKGAESEGWEMDYEKLRRYLTTRYGVTRAFVFGGTSNRPDRVELHEQLVRLGYEVLLVPTRFYKDAPPKADVDSRMTFEMMRMEKEYDKAVVFTSDGDFYWVLEYLMAVKAHVWLFGIAARTARDLKRLFGENFADITRIKTLLQTDKNETGVSVKYTPVFRATDAFDGSIAGVKTGYSPADKLSMKRVDNPVRTGEGAWRKVSELKEGMEIAVAAPQGGAAWERIVSVESVAEEDVYDVEIEGTHNFIGNGIVAHNTAFLNQASTTLLSANQAWFGGTATSTFDSAGALTLITPLLVTSGGTGASTLTGLLQGNGAGAVTGITGTAGQFPYYNGTNTLLATSTIFLSTSGNVGIGTTGPTQPLTVVGANDSTPILALFNTGGEGTSEFQFARSAVTGALSIQGLQVGNNNIVLAPTSGNVGIGTTSPVSKLSVVGESAFAGGASVGLGYAGTAAPVGGLIIQGNVGIGTTSPNVLVTIGGANATGAANGINFSGDILANLYRNSAGTLRMDGYLGIGGVGAGTLLEVGARAAITGNVPSPTDNSVVINGSPTLSSVNGPAQLMINDNAALAIDRGGRIGFSVRTTVVNEMATIASLGGYKENASASNYAGYLQFMTRTAAGDNTERMRITSLGNVGIGTTSPVSKLSVLGESAFAGGASVGIGYAGTAAPTGGMIIQGNVGIGTASPGRLLDLYGSLDPLIRIGATAGGYFNELSYISQEFTAAPTSNDNYRIGTNVQTWGAEGGGIIFNPQGVDKVKIDKDGNVGIGTTSPSALLAVHGNSYVSGTSFFGGAIVATSTLSVSGTGDSYILGNVGIGTTSPVSKLSVLGESAFAGGASVGIGYAGTAAPTGGMIIQGNVGIGTTTPAQKLVVAGGQLLINHTSPELDWNKNNASANEGRWRIEGGTSKILSFRAVNDVINDSTEWMRATRSSGITMSSVTFPNGNVGIGTTSPVSKLSVLGESAFAGGASVGIGYAGTAAPTGGMIIQGNVGIGTTDPNEGKVEVKGGSVCVDTDSNDTATSCIANESDQRLKSNIQAISASSSLATILALRPVSFDWRASDPEVLSHYPLLSRFAASPHSIGLIAQEVSPFLPEAIGTETVGDAQVQYFQLDYTKFIPPLIGAVQALDARLGPLAAVLSIVPGVESQCVTGDTKLRRRRRRSDGSFECDEIAIADVAVGDEIASLDEASGQVVYSRVNALIDMGEQEVYELVTKSGRRIRTTSNHPFLARLARPRADFDATPEAASL